MSLADLVFRVVLYPLGKALTSVVFRWFGPLRIEGRENVPRKGALLVCSNHISDADPPAVFYAVPRPAWFMAKEELFSMGAIGIVVRLYRAFPVRRGSPDRKALRRAEELLQGGQCVVVYPEGQCSQSGKLLPMLPGAALILRRARVPCICLGIIGTNGIVPYGSLRPRRAKGPVRIRFGKPFTVEELQDDSIEAISRRIGIELATLTDQPLPDAVEEPRGGPAFDERKNDDPTTQLPH